MQIHEHRWKEKLLTSRYFTILTKLSIDHAPNSKFSFGGVIDIGVKLNLNRKEEKEK